MSSYTLFLTDDDLDVAGFVGGRYCWSEALLRLDIGENQLSEGEAWRLREAFERDAEGGHQLFPLLDSGSDLYRKLVAFLDSIV